MKIKIAHCADLHLGFKNKHDTSLINSNDIIDIFVDILEECKNQKVDFLLISGDLFDDINPGNFEIETIKENLKKFGIKTIISPGNHDPYTIDSPYYDKNWPENVFIFKSKELRFFEFRDLNVRIWGAAFENIYEKNSPLKKITNLDSQFINICVIHGNITSYHNNYYCPIQISEIENSGMDYIALGHIHKRSEIKKIGNTFYAYSGSPYPYDSSETGQKGIYIGYVSKNSCNLEFKKICKYTYEKISIDVTGANSNDSIIDIILDKLKLLYKESHLNNCYEATICGDIDECLSINVSYLEHVLNKKLRFIRIIDNTEIKIDIVKLSYRNDLKGIFVRKALEKIKNSKNEKEKNINNRALKLGLRAFTEDVYYHEN